jgi:enolase
LDSRGTPTVEAAVVLENQVTGSYAVPSGASTGVHEALELRDGDKSRFGGLGTSKAVANVNGAIQDALIGQDVTNQKAIDDLLISLDGTPNKEKLGANAILAASVACAKAAAASQGIPIYQYIGGSDSHRLPVPFFNVVNGGAHADSGLDVQEYMIAPYGLPNVQEAVRAGVEIYRALKGILAAAGHRVSVGDEGGFAPRLESNEEALGTLVQAIQSAGYDPGSQVGIVLDVAATEFYRDGNYHLKVEGKPAVMSSADMVGLYDKWVSEDPIIGIEDGMSEDDWEGWDGLTKKLGSRIQLIGDDLFVTNVERLNQGIERKIANAIIIKPNQIGTLTETVDTVRLAQRNNYACVMANRSAENSDGFIASLAIALGNEAIKTGAPCRGERVAKYN